MSTRGVPGAHGSPTRRVRCAIYTRKSSDEGLEQSFNSLDAQREACAAYIRSQASEGWSEIADRYDDGSLSGGTLERPALQRLLGDIAAGGIDVVVVYKVDRLTRSLLDFARLVERFEASGTSFLSVTQSFNTTSSMGRLTLNMLLSFAQFEREVTAERIRDKIAASKARGMWMGGIPPLGYAPNGRSLLIVEEHARFVRMIFERYLDVGTVRLLAERLAAEGLHAPARITGTGKTIGARPLSRGQLYTLLKCRTYLGEVQHKEQVYPGLHAAILSRDLWDRVQAQLAAHVQGSRAGRRATTTSLLAGKLVDAAGQPLIAVHTGKACPDGARRRYRYYVSRSLHHKDATTGLRLPAREIEQVVTERLATLFDDPLALVGSAHLQVRADQFATLDQRCRELAAKLRQRDAATVSHLLAEVRIDETAVALACGTAQIAAALGLEPTLDAPERITLTVDAALRRSGRAMRLVRPGGVSAHHQADPALVRLLVLARRWWGELREGTLDVTSLAAREQRTPTYVTRIVKLAFLSPAVVDAILKGQQRHGVDVAALTLSEPVPAAWKEQGKVLLPAM